MYNLKVSSKLYMYYIYSYFSGSRFYLSKNKKKKILAKFSWAGVNGETHVPCVLSIMITCQGCGCVHLPPLRLA